MNPSPRPPEKETLPSEEKTLPTTHYPLPTKIVLLAAGAFPSHPVPLRALREADFLVCCDSAYNSLPTTHHPLPTKYIVIGDGDSLSDEVKRQLGDRWIHVAEQDYNDLHKAMCWATAKFNIRNSKFIILSATGRREDHTLGNISYLATFADEYPGIDLEMLTDYGRFILLSPNPTLPTTHHQLPTFPGQQISIFPVDPAVPFSATGLRWPIDNMQARLWWQATLNEALADTFTLDSAAPLLVFRTYDAK